MREAGRELTVTDINATVEEDRIRDHSKQSIIGRDPMHSLLELYPIKRKIFHATNELH